MAEQMQYPGLRNWDKEVYEECIAEKFWGRVNVGSEFGCWEWTGRTNSGYGVFSADRRNYYTHRFAWELVNGNIPADMLVLHDCPIKDNRCCCNPAHLKLGTYKINSDDAVVKGTSTLFMNGERYLKAKLTNDKVKLVREGRELGFTYAQLADMFKVSPSNIRFVVTEATWKE